MNPQTCIDRSIDLSQIPYILYLRHISFTKFCFQIKHTHDIKNHVFLPFIQQRHEYTSTCVLSVDQTFFASGMTTTTLVVSRGLCIFTFALYPDPLIVLSHYIEVLIVNCVNCKRCLNCEKNETTSFLFIKPPTECWWSPTNFAQAH